MNGNCAVVCCMNSVSKLCLWKKTICNKHTGLTHSACSCTPSFCLYSTPIKLRIGTLGNAWIQSINRVSKKEYDACVDKNALIHFNEAQKDNEEMNTFPET